MGWDGASEEGLRTETKNHEARPNWPVRMQYRTRNREEMTSEKGAAGFSRGTMFMENEKVTR